MYKKAVPTRASEWYIGLIGYFFTHGCEVSPGLQQYCLAHGCIHSARLLFWIARNTSFTSDKGCTQAGLVG